MDLVSLCPLHAWGFVWQSQDGRHAQTVVVKATFKLTQSKVTLAEEQDAANEEDGYWNDDPSRGIVAPSDKAPYKPRADIMLVGHAYAPNKQPTRAVVARVTIGNLDKAIEVVADRAFRLHDGQLLEGQRFAKARLSWDRAAGGPDTNNPVGMRFDAQPDAYGMIPIPNLQPAGFFVSKRSDVFAPICFAPIAPAWPGRVERLGRAAGAFPKPGWTDVPLPEGLDPMFFQAAPPDQQVPEIRANERIILENLHPDHPRVVTSLPGLRPRAFVERATGEREEVAFVADTLLIDTDRLVCVVVWRGRIGLRHPQEAGRISVTLAEEMDTAAPSLAPQRARAAVIDENTNDDDQEAGLTTVVPPNETSRSAQKSFAVTLTATGSHARVMPFVGADQGAARPAAQPGRPADAALPFVRTDGPPSAGPPGAPSGVPWPMSAGSASAMPVAPPMGSPPGLAPPGTVVPPLMGAPAPKLPGQVVPPAPISPQPVPPMAIPPAPVPPAAVAPVPVPPVVPAPVPVARGSSPEPVGSPWASGPPTGAVAGVVGMGVAAGVVAAAAVSSAKAGSAQALSDAAADAQTRSAPAAPPAVKPFTPNSSKFARLQPNDVLDLLWYEESFVPRIRANWEELVTELDFEPADPRKDLNVEDPEKVRVRHNVFGILSDGDVVEPSGLSRVINEAVNQRGRFTPPLALTGGELRFPFDEVETLKAMIVAMTPFLGSDKRLKEMVDGMTELLKTPYLQGSTGIVDKLARDLRAQFRESNRSLPATYLDGHVERLLLEQRRYAIRKVFGGEFIRALLTVYVPDGQAKGSDATIPVYLPKSLDQTLPMLVTMRVRLIVECHLQQDPYDTSPYALRTVALGRSYQLDALRSGAKAS